MQQLAIESERCSPNSDEPATHGGLVKSTEQLTCQIVPQCRVDVIDVRDLIRQRFGGALDRYRKAVYYSYHTTAGYFDQRLSARLNHCRDSVHDFVSSFQTLFPPNADYRHDQLQLRTELTESQKENEPLNADSHLTFIGSGLANCVTYANEPEKPVFFVDLDGVYGEERRTRQTTVIGFNQERPVLELLRHVPVSGHPIDSINLRDPGLGLFEELQFLLDRYDVETGRIDISLETDESHAGLTVNEYETLLMTHDLREVLRNPFRYMAQKSLHMVEDPRAIPGKAINYAKYDLVRFVNSFLDTFGLSESLVERMIDKFLAYPASRFLRMKRSLSMLVSDQQASGQDSILSGTYQSPILVQWKKPSRQARRRLKISIVSFD